MKKSPTLSIRANGPLAIFTRPELKTERVSYEVPTPSAVRGIFEAICWKPAIQWHVERILIFKEIVFTSIKRNELNLKASVPTKLMMETGQRNLAYGLEAETVRAQRNTIALKNVDYQFDAFFSLTDRAGKDDNIFKFVDMFSRRVEKGQHFHQPYFGCRECIADIHPPLENPHKQCIQLTKNFGIMLWDIEFGTGENRKNTAKFFNAVMTNGIINVPLYPIGRKEEQS